MGFCGADDDFDAFFSYARTDDTVNNRWVVDFHQYIQEFVRAELQRDEAIRNDDAERFNVLLDRRGFPQAGPLDETIVENVTRSEFLFIFLGMGYLRSHYCLTELETFRKKVGGVIDEALRRTYIVVIDQEAVRRLKDAPPETLSPERAVLWRKLQDFSQRGIRKEDLLADSGVPLPVLVRNGEVRAAEPFHGRCLPLVREFKRKLVERRAAVTGAHPTVAQIAVSVVSGQDAQSHPAPPKAPPVTIAVGVVPRRLEGVRADLIARLGAANVVVLEHLQLRAGLELLRSRLAGIRLFIQPFDRGEVLAGRGDPPGGHLALARKLFDECIEAKLLAPGATMIWWQPVAEPSPGVGSGLAEAPAPELAEPVPPLDPFDATFVDNIPKVQIHSCSPRDLAAHVGPAPDTTVLARIWLAKDELDAEIVTEAQKRIREVWEDEQKPRHDDAASKVKVELRFVAVDWYAASTSKSTRWVNNYEGLVLVDGSEDFETLDAQVNKVDELAALLKGRFIAGLFVVPPNDRPRLEPDEWQVLRFRKTGEGVMAEVDQVRAFVRRILTLAHQNAAGPS